MPISLYIVDDHKMFREGIASLISFEKDMEIIGSAGSVQEFMQDILLHQPDVILMDLSLRDGEGTDAVSWYKEKYPEVKILVLSMHREADFVKKVMDTGANGYILKDEGTEEMLDAIRTVHAGNHFYSHVIMSTIVQQLNKNKTPSKKELAGQKLTRRELEIIKMIADEKSNQEIADKLFISVKTVNTHRNNIMQKLETKNTAGLVRYAIRQGLIEL